MVTPPTLARVRSAKFASQRQALHLGLSLIGTSAWLSQVVGAMYAPKPGLGVYYRYNYPSPPPIAGELLYLD
jgi:hypothetical protein